MKKTSRKHFSSTSLGIAVGPASALACDSPDCWRRAPAENSKLFSRNGAILVGGACDALPKPKGCEETKPATRHGYQTKLLPELLEPPGKAQGHNERLLLIKFRTLRDSQSVQVPQYGGILPSMVPGIITFWSLDPQRIWWPIVLSQCGARPCQASAGYGVYLKEQEEPDT